MEVKIRPTNVCTEIGGTPARVWEGRTSAGVPVRFFVLQAEVRRRDVVDVDQVLEFVQMLEQLPPTEFVPIEKVGK